MIKIIRGGHFTKIVSDEPHKVTRLARVFKGEAGPIYDQPQDICFTQGKGDVWRSSSYALGAGKPYVRIFRAKPAELERAFAEAGIPVRIVPRSAARPAPQASGEAPRLAA